MRGVSVFFFKQKTTYEMRISDWSSDVCSSDLGNTQMLGRKNLGRGFETLGDASLIFGAWPAGVWLRQEALPRLCLLDLREQRHPYDACEEEVLLALTCYDSVGDILDRLRDQMASFAPRFASSVEVGRASGR